MSKEMSYLTVGSESYEVVDAQARTDISKINNIIYREITFMYDMTRNRYTATTSVAAGQYLMIFGTATDNVFTEAMVNLVGVATGDSTEAEIVTLIPAPEESDLNDLTFSISKATLGGGIASIRIHSPSDAVYYASFLKLY